MLLAAGPWAYILPVVLLVCSNVFMTLAWYGHLNYKAQPLVAGGAGVLGHRLHRVLPGGAGQSLRPRGLLGGRAQDHPGGRDADRVRGRSRCCICSEPLGWNHAVGFLLIAAGAGFIFSGKA